MDIDRSVVPAGSAAPKRMWISPAVLDLGGISTLTLQSGGGICDPFEDPNCP